MYSLNPANDRPTPRYLDGRVSCIKYVKVIHGKFQSIGHQIAMPCETHTARGIALLADSATVFSGSICTGSMSCKRQAAWQHKHVNYQQQTLRAGRTQTHFVQLCLQQRERQHHRGSARAVNPLPLLEQCFRGSCTTCATSHGTTNWIQDGITTATACFNHRTRPSNRLRKIRGIRTATE